MALLYHRNVTPFDVIAARMIVEIAGNTGNGNLDYWGNWRALACSLVSKMNSTLSYCRG
jgi:hypothetical protein